MEAFKAEVSEYWGKPIDLLRMMAFVVFELGNDVVDCLNKGIEAGEIERSYALDLSLSFQARASQLLNEIIELLACGFPEAALARWRTLHEFHVTAAFVFEIVMKSVESKQLVSGMATISDGGPRRYRARPCRIPTRILTSLP